jgi:CRP/FNR family transcriptional regulator, dissimilatory nitrate respiration regulator
MEFLELIPESVSRRVTYENLVTGQTLFLENDPAQAFFVLESGQIKLLHYTESGQIVQHYRIFAGESFAEVTLFNDRYLCTAIAEAPSRVVIFPKQPFLEALQQDLHLSSRMIEQLARRLHQTKTLITTRSIRSARDRVLHYLRVIVPPNTKNLILDRPLKDIASDIGISPEVLSRTLRQLKNEGLLIKVGRKITFGELFQNLSCNDCYQN